MSDQKTAPPNTAQAVVAVLIFAAIIWFYFGGGLEQQTATTISGIEKQVANDAVTQYNIAARNGTSMDNCVQAGMVTDAYLQAKDEPNYKTWKDREARDCNAAGVPR